MNDHSSAFPPDCRIRLWHFFVLVVLYVAVAQGLSIATAAGQNTGDDGTTTIEGLVGRVIVPVGVAVIVALGFITSTRAWQSIFIDRHRLSRWALLIPAVLIVLTIVITNYSGLSEKGLTYAALLFVATMMVGFAEELVFRGVGVQAFRQHGFREGSVALWTSVVFGLSHGTNAVVTGDVVGALVQVVLTTGTGYVFYLVLRGTGALTLAMLAHGLWDFGALSTQVDPENPSPLVNLAAIVLAVILLGTLVFRRRLGLTGAPREYPRARRVR